MKTMTHDQKFSTKAHLGHQVVELLVLALAHDVRWEVSQNFLDF